MWLNISQSPAIFISYGSEIVNCFNTACYILKMTMKSFFFNFSSWFLIDSIRCNAENAHLNTCKSELQKTQNRWMKGETGTQKNYQNLPRIYLNCFFFYQSWLKRLWEGSCEWSRAIWYRISFRVIIPCNRPWRSTKHWRMPSLRKIYRKKWC